MKALILIADGFEDSEFFTPYYRLKEEGVEVDVASLREGDVTGKHGYVFKANLSFKDANPQEYDILVLPGGKAPERIRLDAKATAIARHFMEDGKVVASICHGVQLLISAGVVSGRRGTCWRGIQDDLKNAGARVSDVSVVVDGNWVSSRQPSDLPDFIRELVKKINGVKR